MATDNPLYNSLDETYFQGEYVYNYGGYVPVNAVDSPYISFTLQNPNPFPVGVLYTDFCGEYKATTITPFTTSGFCIDTRYSYQIPSTLNIISSGTTCSQFCPSPTPTPTPSITLSPSITPSITTSVSVSPTLTPSVSISPTPGSSLQPTPSLSLTTTPTISITPTISTTPNPSISITPSISVSPSSAIPAPLSMTIVGTGNFVGYSGTWKPSQNINKDLYSSQVPSPTYRYYKFRSYTATAMIFYKTTQQKMLWWRGSWSFSTTFSHYPTYPLETWIGVLSPQQPEYFSGGVNQINGLGWPGEGTYMTNYGNVSITYNYPA